MLLSKTNKQHLFQGALQLESTLFCIFFVVSSNADEKTGDDQMHAAAVFLYFFLTIPTRIDFTAIIHLGSSSDLQGSLSICMYGFSKTLHYQIKKKAGKINLFLSEWKLTKQLSFHRRKKRRYALPVKRLLNLWINNCFAEVNAQIGLPDAANTAYTCALMNILLNRVSLMHANVVPLYNSAEIKLQFHCIAAFRLGKLCLTAAYLAADHVIKSFSGGAWHGNRERSADQLSNTNGDGKHQGYD